MPNYKKHLAGGAIAYSCLLYLLLSTHPTLNMTAQWFTCCLTGALFPDIDTKSKIQKIFYVIIFITLIAAILNKKIPLLIFFSFLGLIPALVNHRGIFHNPIFILLLTLTVIGIIRLYVPGYTHQAFLNGLFFFVGAISHIWLDFGFKKMIRI